MKIIGMIPARGGSSRFSMKPLAQICGKPMLYWVWKHSKEVECFEEVYVATDNELIKETAEGDYYRRRHRRNGSSSRTQEERP